MGGWGTRPCQWSTCTPINRGRCRINCLTRFRKRPRGKCSRKVGASSGTSFCMARTGRCAKTKRSARAQAAPGATATPRSTGVCGSPSRATAMTPRAFGQWWRRCGDSRGTQLNPTLMEYNGLLFHNGLLIVKCREWTDKFKGCHTSKDAAVRARDLFRTFTLLKPLLLLLLPSSSSSTIAPLQKRVCRNLYGPSALPLQLFLV